MLAKINFKGWLLKRQIPRIFTRTPYYKVQVGEHISNFKISESEKVL